MYAFNNVHTHVSVLPTEWINCSADTCSWLQVSLAAVTEGKCQGKE